MVCIENSDPSDNRQMRDCTVTKGSPGGNFLSRVQNVRLDMCLLAVRSRTGYPA